jgi:hypothetical protein
MKDERDATLQRLARFRIRVNQHPAIALAIIAAVLLWAPLLFRSGYVFERDPAFYASLHADTAWSLGGFSFQGGVSNIGSQGVFYEPFAAVIWLISHLGIPLSAATWSKIVPFFMTAIAAGGAFSLARRFDATFAGGCMSALFYIFNPWSLECFGYFYYWTGYCLLPLLILGTIRIRNGEKSPLWLPIAILFLGGLVSWVLGAIVCVLVAATMRIGAHRSVLRTTGRLGIVFLGVGAYWICAYLFSILFPSPLTSLSYPSLGPPLQSPHPVTDLLELRDFWWPHLDLSQYVGILPLAISTFAVVILVFIAIGHVAVGFNHDPMLDTASDPQGMLRSLIVVGLVLGFGIAGATGWIVRLIRAWPLFGDDILRSITREPARLASPFVAALAVALALWIKPRTMAHDEESLRLHNARQNLLKNIVIFTLLAAACAPSLIAFWGTYRPIQIPASYDELSSKIPKGTSLEIAYWPLNALVQSEGLWHFVWSGREVSDPTLLAASVRPPSVSALDVSVNLFDQQVETESPSKASVKKLVDQAQSLGVTSLVVELDIQLPDSQRASLNEFVSSLRRDGLAEKNLGTELVFDVPGPVRTPLWGKNCQINNELFFAGFVHVDCHRESASSSGVSILSPFELPSPAIGLGIDVKSQKTVGSIGTEMNIVGGNSGWIVFLPNFAVAIGGLLTLLYLLALASQPMISMARSYQRRRHRNHSEANLAEPS